MLSRFDWLSEYLTRLEDEHILVRAGSAARLAPAHRLELDTEDWGRAGRVARAFGCRFAGLWGDPLEERVSVYACLEYQGDYLVLATRVPLKQPALASLTPSYPGADRLERHLHDLCGIVCLEHPDNRRCTRHQSFCERVIGTFRRECLDFLIPITESHLRCVSTNWVAHYNKGRPAQAYRTHHPTSLLHHKYTDIAFQSILCW